MKTQLKTVWEKAWKAAWDAHMAERKANPRKTPNRATLAALLEAHAGASVRATIHLSKRIDALESELATCREQLAQVQTLKYMGTYERDRQYQTGDVVTDAGSMWVCRRVTITRPGEGASGWQLAVKRGRDGKDAPRDSRNLRTRTTR